MKSIIIIAILFLFPFCTWSGTFLETFDHGDLEGWQELSAHDALPGSWEIIDGELQAIIPGASRYLITGDETWKDYSIQVDVMPLEKPGPGNISILARVKGNWAVDCGITDLIFNDPESKVVCSSLDVHANEGTVLHIEPYPALRSNKWSRLKLSVNGDHFSFWINEKKIVETGGEFVLIQDGREFQLKTMDLSRHPVDTGGAGFGLAYHTARFDNITIIGDSIPDKGRLPVSPQANLSTMWSSLKQF